MKSGVAGCNIKSVCIDGNRRIGIHAVIGGINGKGAAVYNQVSARLYTLHTGGSHQCFLWLAAAWGPPPMNCPSLSSWLWAVFLRFHRRRL